MRVPRDHAKLVYSAATNITSINKIPLKIDILHVGGTVRLCQNAAIKYDKEMLDLDEKDTDL
jgi:RNase P/RNase MRP subunit POP5